jgi:HD-GYP domain-containing protein (c-di-GMP phosphodiesterase class II)
VGRWPAAAATGFERKVQALRNANSKPETARDIALQDLGKALDQKSAETGNHSKRVTVFTIAIARIMGFDDEQVRVFARGVFLHNIGNLAIPESILQKQGALTPEETAILREHCRYGYQIVRKIPFLEAAAEIILSHHEFWDGTGYPRGLREQQIPIGARIFAVAAALEEMTTESRRHPAQPLNAAKEEIQSGSGRQFEPAVVNAFLSMPDHIWGDLRREIDSGTQPGH